MSCFHVSSWRACALAAAFTVGAAPGFASATTTPLSDFFDNPSFSSARLSPDAKSLAVISGSPGSRDRLAIVDLVNNTGKTVAQFAQADVGSFEWVSSNRLVFTSTDKQIGPGDARYGPGLYAVDRDGSNFKQLVDVSGNGVTEHTVGRGILPYNHYLAGLKSAQNSDAVYVYRPHYLASGEMESINLVRIDTRTGRDSTVRRPGNTQAWVMDAKGEPRLAVTVDKNIEEIHYLDPATQAWRKLASFDTYIGGKGAITPIAFAPDGTLYVISNAGRNEAALFRFDFSTNTTEPAPVIALKGFDFAGDLITRGDKLLGIEYVSDARATLWIDPQMKAVQAAVDALLPDTVNVITVAERAELPLVLVVSYSDRQPCKFALFNTATGKLNPVGETHPNIKPSQMAEQELVHVKARDGMDIPAWITIPGGSNKKDLPMVVLVHGGPYVRGTQWGWSADAQFLASRGYAVLEPEFRGSTGYGSQHYRAGWKQWGLAMQNDIADATRWAIAQGKADPKRICIAGASYGGYATLMGLVNDPDLYQCGINWVGVTDINLLYTGHWSFASDIGDAYKQYGMPTLVGDQVKDAVQLNATSPLAQAARIKRPLLMAYGAADQRVPLYHGKLFYNAVKATNPNVELIVYDEEAHGWKLPRNRIDFWGRVEKFLEQNIGKK